LNERLGERERFLSREEAGRLLDAIAQRETTGLLAPTFADALRVLLLTGARKTEVWGCAGARWISNARSLAFRPSGPRPGERQGCDAFTFPPERWPCLARRKAAQEALEAADGSPYVFPAARGSGHATGLRKAFVDVCAACGLDGVRVHDLRHSFASFALADGASLFLIGKALGHANARTTERYAHLRGDPLADLAAAVGARLAPASSDVDAAVLPFRRA